MCTRAQALNITRMTKAVLEDLYVEKKTSIVGIAQHFKVCELTISNRLDHFGISRRNPHVNPEPALLRQLYQIERKTLAEIATMLDCCPETVSRRLKEARISIRLGPRYHTGNLKVPSDERMWAYLAGFVDGEGSICLCARGSGLSSPSVQICNTDVRVMRWLVHNFGGSYNGRETTSPMTGQPAKRCYYWAIRRVGAVLVLCDRMLPYLVIKAEKARTVLDVCKGRVSA